MLSNLLIALAIMVGVAIVVGVLLALSNKYFAVEEDTRVEGIINNLPGLDCGACGFVNCSNLAKAILKGETRSRNACSVISEELRVKLIDYCASIEDDEGKAIILK